MMQHELSSLWTLYGETFRLHVHQLLVWAHQDARPNFHPGLTEPDMTGLLAQAMKQRLNSHPDTPQAYDHYWVGDQEPHSPFGELGNNRLRLDITVIRNGIRPRLTFVLEAKRLRTGGYPIGKYVGSGGMGDFISGRYSADSPEAAMVALCENKSPSYWQAELKRALDEDAGSADPVLSQVSPLSAVSVIAELPDEFESTHRRKNGPTLRLFHLFLDCCHAS